MNIKYMFIVQRYRLMTAAAGGVLQRDVVSDRHRRVGGQRPRRSGRQSPRSIRSVEDAAPGVAALPAHGLDREQHLLTIRTPRTTSAKPGSPCPCSRRRRTVPSRHGAPALLVMTPEQEAAFDLIGRQRVPAALVPFMETPLVLSRGEVRALGMLVCCRERQLQNRRAVANSNFLANAAPKRFS